MRHLPLPPRLGATLHPNGKVSIFSIEENMEFQSKELRANVKVEQQEPDPTVLQDPLRSETEEPDPNDYELTLDQAEQVEPQIVVDTKIEKRSRSPIIAVRVESDHETSSPSRPTKRQKLDKVALVPLAAVKELDAAAQALIDKDLEMLKSMKNPLVKKIKDMELSLSIVRDRLIPIGVEPFNVTLPMTSRTMVTRPFMSSTYGGNRQKMFPTPSQKFLDTHGMDDWMYINPEFQPEGPKRQVLLACISILWPETQYMGMYEVKRSTPPALTQAEWLSQADKVKKAWAKEISTKGWGYYARVLVLGRKMYGDKELTEKERDKVEARKDALKKVTPEEILRVYNDGFLRLGVWTMKCVGYDNAFQLELGEKFAAYVPPPPPPKAAKADKGPKPPRQKQKKAQATSKTPGNKRKRQSSESVASQSDSDSTDEEGEWEAEQSDEDDDGFALKRYRNKGTRSRPI
ncbi:hypothetical protein D9613_011356 [Agrocybe pediades]|uniref:DUF6697 domain-containing protein n=1 Tax=Agrocybe pediades TaxID=84607 RepID=A0A8H4QSJ8_9AGAR|nr:hypothetical protein D9613_011356 [Agrocybe pediades]